MGSILFPARLPRQSPAYENPTHWHHRSHRLPYLASAARPPSAPRTGPTPEKGANAIRCYLAAYDYCRLHTIFDHSDVYCAGMSEAVFGETLRQRPGMRDKVVIATKCTVVPPGWRGKGSGHCYDSSKEHILRAATCAAL